MQSKNHAQGREERGLLTILGILCAKWRAKWR